MAEQASWDEATSGKGFVVFETDAEKKLVITNWRNEKSQKFNKDVIEFVSDVIEEDGRVVVDKKFTTLSNRLKSKLRPILESKKPTDKVKLSVLKVGDRFETQYSVKELRD